ncbi:MAG: hypothetical protein JXQ80_10740 [Bacteroidales bacterium]|nr:hypothetical protein [Bacteroidales bacterium]
MSRYFLSLLALFVFLLTLPALSAAGPYTYVDDPIKLNPDYKITRMSNGDVIVALKKPDTTEVNHRFTDFYADLLLAAHRKQRMEVMVSNLSRKFYLSEDECRREIKHAINVLTDWNIVLHEDRVVLK